MDNALYVGLSKQVLLERELDIAANNLANANTTGFKVEALISTPDPVTPPATPPGSARRSSSSPTTASPATSARVRCSPTGAPLDLAIMGQGFFQVTTAAATRYTRDGRFATDAQGQLVTQAGDPVLDASGSPITLNPQGGPPTIGGDGTDHPDRGRAKPEPDHRQGRRGQLRRHVHAHQGGRRASIPTPPTPAQPVTGQVLRQGMLEGSNVQPIMQVTDLIRISRAYDMITQHDEFDRKPVLDRRPAVGNGPVEGAANAMMALRTAATGMAAQDLNVDVISNNIANMNTVGFKKGRAEFEDLIYQNVEQAGSQSSSQGTIVPTGVQVGAGVKAGSVYTISTQGSLTQTGNPLDLAIQGRGLLPGPAARSARPPTPAPATSR